MIDSFKRHAIIEMLRVLLPPKTFILDTFFNRTRTFDTESVKIDVKQSKRRLAPFVNPKHEGYHVERAGYETKTFTPAYLKPKTSYHPSELLKRQAGEGLESSASSVNGMIAEDLADFQDQVNRTEEWMASRALLDGQVQVVGEGVNATVDFLMDPSHQIVLAGAAQWSDDTSDPYIDLWNWRSQIQQDSGRRADVAIVATDVAQRLINHPVFQSQMDNRRIELGQFSPRDLPEGVTYVGEIFGGGLTILAYEEYFINPATGLEEPMIPSGRVILGASGARSERLYGAIQDWHAGGLLEARWFPRAWLDDGDPALQWLMLQSAPLPSPVEVNAYITATVL